MISFVEPFHFGPATASQDGGSGSSWKKFLQKSLLNLPGLVLVKEKYKCFALLFQYFILRDRLILFKIIVKYFGYFFSLNIL